MKIMLVQFASRGGPQLYTYQLAGALSKHHDVTMMLAKHLMNKNYYSGLPKIVLLSCPPSNIKVLLLSLNPLTYYTILKYVKLINPDIIHVTSEFLWITMVLPWLRKRSVIVTEHDPVLHKGTKLDVKLHFWFIRLFTRRMADAIIVHGEKLKRVLINKKIPENRIWVVPHGEFSFYTKWMKEGIKESKTVLFFGTISEYKGIEYLINAEPMISSVVPQLKIIIAGSGDFSRYESMVKSRNVFEIHNRFIPDKEVAELFQRAAVIVLPYIDASQTGIIPIAYSFKKPVIVTDVGSISEGVEEGRTGCIIPPKNTQALAEAIIKILSNDRLRNEMGNNAYKKIQEELSWDNIAEKTVKIYEFVKQSKSI